MSMKLNKNQNGEEIGNNKEKEQKMREETAEKTQEEQPQEADQRGITEQASLTSGHTSPAWMNVPEGRGRDSTRSEALL